MKVLFTCLLDVMKKPVDLTGPKGPFVYYLFYGDHSKNIEHHFGNEMGIEIKKEINSIAVSRDITACVVNKTFIRSLKQKSPGLLSFVILV